MMREAVTPAPQGGQILPEPRPPAASSARERQVVAVVQARMASSRLPGKVLYPLAGTTVLGYLLARVALCERVTRRVVATTTRSEDEPIARWGEALGLDTARHTVSDDVLGRFILATGSCEPDDVVVRLTADNPLVCPRTIDACVGWVLNGAHDYYRTSEDFPEGLDVEAFTVGLLRSIALLRPSPGDREHLAAPLQRWAKTPGHYRLPEPYGHLRLTLDVPEDVPVVYKVAEALEWGQADLRDICRLSRTRPHLFHGNQHVPRNAWEREVAR